MRIRRSKPVDNFTIIPNATLRDERLSYCARGVLAELLSRPSGWEASADALSERARRHRGESVGEGRRALRAAFKELEAAGYMVRHREQGERGRFVTVLEVFDAPQDRGTGDRRTADGTSVRVTSVDATSVSGTSSIRTGVRSTEEEGLLEEDEPPSSSADVPEPANATDVTDGGGGGSDLRSLAEHIADSLDYQGQVPDKRQQEQVTAALLGALKAGWSMQGLAYYLHLGSYRPDNPVAFYLSKLTKKLPDTVPDTPDPAPPAAGGVRGRVLSGAEVEALDVEAAFYGVQPAPVADPETWQEASARVTRRMVATAPSEGTDGTVAGWWGIRDQLAAEEARKGSHRPYSNDDWYRPATPEECAGIPWCQDVECSEIGRMREYVDDNGIKHDTQCEKCHPQMLGIWGRAS